MLIKLTLLAAALSMPTIALAKDSSPVEISASGEGNWYVRCQDDSSTIHELNKDRPAYKSANISSAACHYEASKRGLTIKISGDGWACPFKGAADGACTLVDKNGSGEFRLKHAN